MKSLKCYRWQAVDSQAQLVSGELLARDPLHATQQLAIQQQFPYRLSRCRPGLTLRWPAQNLILFFSQLGQLLASGLTLTESLDLLIETQPSHHWHLLCQQIRLRLTQGEQLSLVIREWPQVFPSLCRAMLDIGETTGQLAHCCQTLAALLTRQRQLKHRVRQALRYPLFTLFLIFLVTVLLLSFVLPEFAALYHSFNAPLPTLTRQLLLISQQLDRIVPCLLVAVTLLSLIGYGCLKHRPKWRLTCQRYAMKIPKLGELSQAVNLARLFSTLTLTQQSGLPLIKSLELAQSTLPASLWQWSLSLLRSRLEQGDSLATAIQGAEEYPPLCFRLLRAAELSGDLENQLGQLAQWYQQRANELGDQLTAAMQPAMMLISGGLVGGLVIALYLPILNMGTLIN